MMKTRELAGRIGIHPSTLRVWCTTYAEYLSKSAVGRTTGINRELSERDCLILATIADMRNNGISHEAIVAIFQTGNLAKVLSNVPTVAETGSISMAEFNHALGRVRTLEDERARLIAERDGAQGDIREANRKMAELEREIGQFRGRFEEIRWYDWWLKYIAIAVLILCAVVIGALAFGYIIRGG